MSKNPDIKSIFSYLKKEEIKIDYEEFEFQVESHPDFPSLLAYSDALSFFKIENAAIRVTTKDKEKFPDNFVALLQDKEQGEVLSFIQVSKNQFLKDEKPITWQELKKQWGGIMLLADQNSQISELKIKKTSHLKWFILSTSWILFMILLTTEKTPLRTYVFLLLSSFGLLVAIETFKQILGIKSSFSKGFCNTSPSTDCDSVINSNKWSFFKKVNLSDIAIIFFFGQLASLFFMSLSSFEGTFFSLQSWGLWLTIPISIVSIYYQWKIEKKWCPLCLLLVFILYLELICTRLFPTSYSFSIVEFLLFLGVNLFTLSLWLFLKPMLIKNKDLKETQLENLRFRRNYKLFRLALNSENSIEDNSLEGAIILGNKNANLKIDIVTNPYCGYCKEAHELIENILEKHFENVSIYLRFNYDPSTNDVNRNILFKSLVQIYIDKGQNMFLTALKTWFDTKNIESWKKQYEQIISAEKVDKITRSQYRWCKANNLLFTPAFVINDHLFPNTYDKEDLPYFIDDLVEDSSKE
ncbi:vitamin K epoxide reductase family protein [Aquimarina macrocephali]|uniref:vitamin K epoxide reductase family protein n=1 Tax=Aquimarina macrocephali TaxID=666563 RepID=UPI003F6804C5